MTLKKVLKDPSSSGYFVLQTISKTFLIKYKSRDRYLLQSGETLYYMWLYISLFSLGNNEDFNRRCGVLCPLIRSWKEAHVDEFRAEKGPKDKTLTVCFLLWSWHSSGCGLYAACRLPLLSLSVFSSGLALLLLFYWSSHLASSIYISWKKENACPYGLF